MRHPARLIESERSRIGSTIVPFERPLAVGSRIVADFEVRPDGMLAGTIRGRAAVETHEVFIALGRRMIGRAPITWEPTTASANGSDRNGSFKYDLRLIPFALLLESEVEIEIRPSHEPATILASRTVDTCTIYAISSVPLGRGQLEGYIDTKEDGIARGWVWDPTSPQRRVQLHLFVDGTFCGRFEANAPRPDLEATGRGDGGYGFNIPAKEFLARAGGSSPRVELISMEPEFWRVPLAPHLAPRPRQRFKLPRLRRLPETMRELAAYLVSGDPLPKKIFVLERFRGRMPDAFSSDYLVLALEFLRIEMVKSMESAPSTSAGRIVTWCHQWLINQRINRLAALAQATAASQGLLRKEDADRSAVAGGSEAHEKS